MPRIHCSACGKKFSADAAKCPQCGKAPPEPVSSGLILAVIGGGIILVLVVALLFIH